MDKNKPLERWHGAHHYSNKVHLFFIFSLFFVLAIFIWSYIELNSPKLTNYVNKPTPLGSPKPTAKAATPTPKQVFCTQEAMLCPDGKTYVGRTGPNCEFTSCPTN